jgi:hypothetical protein
MSDKGVEGGMTSLDDASTGTTAADPIRSENQGSAGKA